MKSETAAFGSRQPAFNSGQHFLDLNVEQTHLFDLALPKMMTLADLGA